MDTDNEGRAAQTDWQTSKANRQGSKRASKGTERGNEEQSVKECRRRERDKKGVQIKTETPSEESFLHSPANCCAGEEAML